MIMHCPECGTKGCREHVDLTWAFWLALGILGTLAVTWYLGHLL